MAFYSKTETFQSGPKKRTSIGNGLRKRGSFKKGNGSKKYKWVRANDPWLLPHSPQSTLPRGHYDLQHPMRSLHL